MSPVSISGALGRAVAALFAGVALAQSGPGPGERRIALLVGIDEYAPGLGQPAALRGTRNDIRLARELLTGRFGFVVEDADVLLGAQATHAAIVQAFHRRLIERADRDTRVVFWYSGHGSLVPDRSGRETHKDRYDLMGEPVPQDGSLVAWDSRADGRHGEFDVSDDEVHSLLAALAEKTDKITVVMDCCHAGGNVRGGGSRSVPAGTHGLDLAAIRSFWPPAVRFRDDDERDGMPPLPGVQIAACEATQSAGEIELAGTWHGTLTWFLAQTLAEVQPGQSWREVAARTRARVAGQGRMPDQLVECEGAGLDLAVFGGGFHPPPPGHAAEWHGKRQLRIAAGRVHGIGDDGAFTLVDGQGREFGPAVVDRVHAAVCLATLAPGAERPPAAGPLRALPRAGGHGRAPLRLALGEGIAPELVRDQTWAVVVPAADAEYRLERVADRLWLRDRDGDWLRSAAAARAELTAALFHEHAFRGLWEAPAQPGGLALGLEALPADAAARAFVTADLPAAMVTRAQGPLAHVVAPFATKGAGGGVLSIAVRNTSTEPLHVVVLSVAENRSVRMIWPPDDRRDNVLRPGEEQRVPVRVGPDRDWHARHRRPMRDRYVAFATFRFADFRPFCSDAPASAVERGGDGLPRFLARALSPDPRRGGDGAGPGYGIAWYDLTLRPE